MTKKETNLSGTLSEAVSVATSVAYTRQEIQKLKTELVSLLEKKTTEVIVEQVPGPVGPRGALGATGTQGPKGDKGDKGNVGERGEKGEVGPQGNMGPDGLRGLKGEKGDVGLQGVQGIAGNRGEKGDKGEDGKNGLDGRDGEAGNIGPAGPTGEKGIQGERGEKGDRGDRGDSGKDGQQGIQGSVGPRGEIGPQGIQGLPGKDGKDADVKAIEKSINQFKEGLQKDVSQYKAKVNTIISSGIGGGSGGSGEVNLRYLDDIDRNSIQDGFVLSFDEASQKFVFVEQSGGGGGTIDVFARARANTAWNTANSAYLQANSAYNQANLSFTQANVSFTQANSAYNQANNANSLAQAVYNYANTLTFSGDGTDNLARSIANSAYATANTKSYTFSQNTAPVTANTNDFWANTDSAVVYYNFSNTATPLWVEFGPVGTGGGSGSANLIGYATNTTVNLVWSTANSAYAQANTGTTLAQAAYNYANTIVVPSLSGYAVNTTVNTIWSTANSAYTQANTATTLAQAAYNYANTIVVPSLSGYAVNTIVDIVWSNSNSAFSTANASYNQANTATTNASNANTKAQAAYDYANTIVVPSLSGYATNTTVNLVWSTANSAYAQANSANSLAQAAYNQANTGGGTSQLINGSSIVSLGSDGVLTVPGPINGLGNSKLDFTTYGSNTAYLTTTSDDSTALYISLAAAELYANTTVQIRTNTAGVSKNWTFFEDGTLTFPDNTVQTTAWTGAVNGPAFRAYINIAQAITSGSQQKVTFGTETFDTNNNFSSSRFTPTIEGYYQLNATVRIDGTSSTGEYMLVIWKNGTEYARGTNASGTEQGANFYSMQVSDLAYANGSTDYFEIYIQQTSGSNRNTTAGTNISYFSGSMVRGA